MVQRVTALVGLICLGVIFSLCLAAFLFYEHHAQQVVQANVVVAKAQAAEGGLYLFPAIMGNPKAGELARAGLEPKPAIPLEMPPGTRWCLIGAVPFAIGAVICFFILGDFGPAVAGTARRIKNTLRRRRQQDSADQARPLSPPTDYGSLPQFPGS